MTNNLNEKSRLIEAIKIPHISILTQNISKEICNILRELNIRFIDDLVKYSDSFFLNESNISTEKALRIIEIKYKIIQEYCEKKGPISQETEIKTTAKPTKILPHISILTQNISKEICDILRVLNIRFIDDLVKYSDSFFLNESNISTEKALRIIEIKYKIIQEYCERKEPISQETEIKTTAKPPRILPHIPLFCFSLYLSEQSYLYLKNKGIEFIDGIDCNEEQYFYSSPELKRKYVRELVSFVELLKEKYKNGEIVDFYITENQLEELETVSISELNLSERSFNALSNENINTLSKLVVLNKTDLLDIRALGNNSATEIFQSLFNWLQDYGKKETISIQSFYFSDTIEEFLNNITKELSHFLCLTNEIVYLTTKKNNLLDNNSDCSNITTNEFFLTLLNTKEFLPLILNFWKELSNDTGIVEKNKVIDLYSSFQNNETENLLNTLINYSEQSGIIKKIGDTYIIYRIGIFDYFSSLKNKEPENRDYQIVIERLNGKILQEIGENFNITRERARQVISKELKRVPNFFEDYFSSVFEYFCLNSKQLSMLFPFLGKGAFEYLSSKYKKGEFPLTLYYIKEYNGTWKKQIEKYSSVYLKKDITSNHRKFIYYVLKNNRGRSLSVKELITETTNQIKTFDSLDTDKLSKEILSNIESKIKSLRTAKNIVFDKDNKIRYCKVDQKILVEQIDFNRYNNKVISSNLIFREYQELMDTLDIRDGYELYYVLKYSQLDIQTVIPIKFRRVPTVILGIDASEEKQSIDLLNEISPVCFSEFCESYEERFGIRRDVIQGNKAIIEAISPFYSQGKYQVNLELLSKDDEIKLKGYLSSKEFWFIDDLKQIIKQNLSHVKSNQINKNSISRIGYSLNKGYLYSSRFNSIVEYLEYKYLNNDVLNTDLIDSRIKFLPAFISAFSKKRASFELIEVSPKIYYSINKISKEYGLTKNDLTEIQSVSLAICDNFVFFNGAIIWNEITKITRISSKLNNNKFLLSSIIRQSEKVLPFRLGGNIILYYPDKVKENVDLSTICKWFLSEFSCSSVRDLQEQMESYFDIKLNIYKLTSTIRNNGALSELLRDSLDEYISGLAEQSDEDDFEDIFTEEFF